MDWAHQLNEAEISDALAGTPADKAIADCESCAAEFAAWMDLGDGLRRDLASRADMPEYFWARQQASIRERMGPRAMRLRWAAAAVFALILLAFGLIQQGVAPEPQTTAKTQVLQQADPDDVLLQDIHASLRREVPAPLAPAVVLVEEMASASSQAQQTKEN
jgi:hypothetical protein